MPSALDWHLTPQGPMSGPELIINATRAFTVSKQDECISESPVPGPSDWARRGWGVSLAALAMAPIWLTCGWLGQRRRTLREWYWREAIHALIVVAFVGGILVACLIELRHAADTLRGGLSRGQSEDVLTPALALGLEGYAKGVEFAAQSIRGWLMGLWRAGRAGWKAKTEPVPAGANPGEPTEEATQ